MFSVGRADGLYLTYLSIFSLVNCELNMILFQGLCAQTFYGHMHSVNDVQFNLKVIISSINLLKGCFVILG